MSKKSTNGGKVNVTLWLTPEEMAHLDAVVAKKSKNAQVQYPGMNLTRHAMVRQVILKWLKTQKVEK